jgi:hypothetical protein
VRFHHLGAVVVERGVDQRADPELERVEKLEAAPYADAVAVVAPGIVEHVGLRALRSEGGAEPGAEVEMLDVEADVDGEALLPRPAIAPAADDGGVGVPAVAL